MLQRKDLQVVLFSATFPREVVHFASRFAPNANEMTLKHEDLTIAGIKQIYLDCNGEKDKFDVLVKFYGLLTIGSSIIFVKVSTIRHISTIPQMLTSPSTDPGNSYQTGTTHDGGRPQSCLTDRRP